MYYIVQGCLSEYMADTSVTAPFKDTHTADFFRKLVVSQPLIVDWLLKASSQHVEKFRVVINELEKFTQHAHNEKKMLQRQGKQWTRVTDVIDPDYRASVLHWLIFNEEEDGGTTLHRMLQILQKGHTSIRIADSRKVMATKSVGPGSRLHDETLPTTNQETKNSEQLNDDTQPTNSNNDNQDVLETSQLPSTPVTKLSPDHGSKVKPTKVVPMSTVTLDSEEPINL